jgi:hypothetical protein
MSRRDGGMDLAERRLPATSRGNVVPISGLGNHAELRGLLGGFEPMAIAGAGRSRATESDGGQARMAKGQQLTRANGDCGVDEANPVVDPEPERTAWLVSVGGNWVAARQRNRVYD